MANENKFDEQDRKNLDRDNCPEDTDLDINEYYPENEEELVSGTLDEDTVVFAIKERARKKELKKKNGRMTKGQITLISAVSIIYVVLLALAAWVIFYKPPVNTGGLPFDPTDIIDDGEGSETASVVNNGYSELGQAYNILLVGHDKMAHLADVTMIVNVDEKNKTVSVMQIPRDTYVSCEHITGKINAMFSSYYNDAYYSNADDPYIDALDEYASLLEKSLCINIHHTVILNLDGFKNIVDALGGVDVYVPNAMYYTDPEQGLYIDIPAGLQHLDGEKAEGFVRFRSGYVQADLGRVNAQKIFMTAFFSKVKSTVKSVDIGTLNNLVAEIMNNVNTDMTVSDIMYYAKLALKIDLEDITMMTLPGTVSGMYYVMNREATRQAINTYFNVYNKEISDNIFDRNQVFCDTEAAYISNVYYSDPDNILDGAYTADSINDDSIYIPRTQQWTSSSTSNSSGSVPASSDNSGHSGDISEDPGETESDNPTDLEYTGSDEPVDPNTDFVDDNTDLNTDANTETTSDPSDSADDGLGEQTSDQNPDENPTDPISDITEEPAESNSEQTEEYNG